MSIRGKGNDAKNEVAIELAHAKHDKQDKSHFNLFIKYEEKSIGKFAIKPKIKSNLIYSNLTPNIPFSAEHCM